MRAGDIFGRKYQIDAVGGLGEIYPLSVTPPPGFILKGTKEVTADNQIGYPDPRSTATDDSMPIGTVVVEFVEIVSHAGSWSSQASVQFHTLMHFYYDQAGQLLWSGKFADINDKTFNQILAQQGKKFNMWWLVPISIGGFMLMSFITGRKSEPSKPNA